MSEEDPLQEIIILSLVELGIKFTLCMNVKLYCLQTTIKQQVDW